MANDLNILLNKLADDLPGFVAAAIVFIDDGLAIAELSRDDKVEASAASAYLTSIVKANRKAIKLMAGEQVADDILVTTESHYFLIRHVAQRDFFIFVMCQRNEWLGKARLLVNDYEARINTILQARQIG